MLSDIFDTYSYLLENPSLRQIGLSGYQIKYAAAHFNKKIYQNSTGRSFETWELAYKDWLSRGRQEGVEWAEGKDTLLKIVLKAKDELELIDAWISHHSAIVGYENLIIMDCGSTDPRYLKKLEYYKSRILVLEYRRYYDHLHSTRSNASFFTFVGHACKYLTILDADEFLIAKDGPLFSGDFVKKILRREQQQVFCGTWLNTIEPAPMKNGLFDKNSELKIEVSDSAISAGTVAGKAISSTKILMDIGHLGHNLHAQDVMPFVSEKSFGHIFVLHIKNLGPEITQARILKHLFSKGAIAQTHSRDIAEQISTLIEKSDTKEEVRAYAQKYLKAAEIPPTTTSGRNVFSVRLLAENAVEHHEMIDEIISKFDFSSLLNSQRKSLLPESIR